MEIIFPLVWRRRSGNPEKYPTNPGMQSIVTAVYDVPVGESLEQRQYCPAENS